MKYFSPSTRGFYVDELMDLYQAAGGIPTDAFVVDEQSETLFRDYITQGKSVSVVDDVVVWTDKQETIESLKAAVAAKRYAQEVKGVVVNGATVGTDRESVAILTGAAFQAFLDPTYLCRWKTQSGFVELNAQQIIALATSVRMYVQACFEREAALVAAIEAGTYTENMIDEGWPQ